MGLNNTLTQDRPFITVGQDGLSQFNGTDETPIQNAINYLNTLGIGGTIYIKRGTYTLTSSLTNIDDNMVFVGDGQETLITASGNVEFFAVNGKSNISIKNIAFNFNGQTATSGAILKFYNSCTNIFISNCHLEDAKNYLISAQQSCQNVRVSNCTLIANNMGGGLGTHSSRAIDFSTSFNCMADNCTIICSDSTCDFGVNANSDDTSKGHIITNCNISGMYEHAIHLSGSNHVVSSNICRENTVSGIDLAECNNSTISNNIIAENGDIGLILYKCENCLCVGNIVRDNTDKGMQCANTPTGMNTFTGNQCYNNGTFGIAVDSSNYCTVSGNTCFLNGDSGIYLYLSDANTVTGNTSSQNGRHGINISGSRFNSITGNSCQGNARTNNYSAGILINSNAGVDSISNSIVGNNCSDFASVIFLDSLASDATSGQATITMTDSSKFFVGQKVTLSDTTPLTEELIILSIDNDTNIITMTTNLTNSYTTANSASLAGTDTQNYGVREDGAGNTNNVIVANVLDSINQTATGTTEVAHNIIN